MAGAEGISPGLAVSGIEGMSGKEGMTEAVGAGEIGPRVDGAGWLGGGGCDGIGARSGGPEGINPPDAARDGTGADGISPDPKSENIVSSVDDHEVKFCLLGAEGIKSTPPSICGA
jgi:hypothetical protein